MIIRCPHCGGSGTEEAGMPTAWKEIERLISVNAAHRKGFNIGDVGTTFILWQAKDEFNELFNDRTNPEELADLLGVLYHYAIKSGWTLQQLEALMLAKFKQRFTEASDVKKGGE